MRHDFSSVPISDEISSLQKCELLAKFIDQLLVFFRIGEKYFKGLLRIGYGSWYCQTCLLTLLRSHAIKPFSMLLMILLLLLC
ncbi:MAG: hypothetical protein AUI36_15700 [Cyanobacteria bacterium 13_1_40CM_2_61_4]|nr:MAG: hypothetical protein AUI36_15700 [Cyanobacteria bacterium 13_1_40CM_2_61_4]